MISTDLGQPANPLAAVGLANFAERLLRAGFSAEAVRRMAVANPDSCWETVAGTAEERA